MKLLNMTIQTLILSGLLLFAGHNYSTASTETQYEVPNTLKASDILPPDFFKSDLYQVDQVVKNDGLMNTYSVKSNFGDFEVFSTLGLYKMAIEIEALQAMKEIEESDTFTKSLKKTGAGTVEGVKHLFTAPTESIEGAGKGLTNLFSRAGEAIFHSDPGNTEDNSFQQLIGFSKSKRIIAERFHVDVYSTNKVLQDKLDTLAWADYAGGITISVAALPLGGPAGVVYSSSNTVRLLNEAIALTPPIELKKQNREKLTKMDMDPNLTDLFINNPHFSPRQQTYIVAAMEALTEAKHREVILMVALQVKDSDMAMSVATIAMMHAGYNNNVAKIKEVETAIRIFGGLDVNGTKILLIPVDYLTWNHRLSGAISRMEKPAGAQGEIWLLGTVSELGQENLSKRGWTVRTKVASQIGVNELGLLKKGD